MRRFPAFVGVGLAIAVIGLSGAGERTVPRSPRHISLLIGAGNYKFAGEWKDLKNLQGPRTDVRRMQHSIRRWGFRDGPDDQRVLVDQQASKAGIEAAFRWLASRATDSSDVVVIYYSGHGSWAPDVAIDGVRTKDEARSSPGDEFDESLVPWDARDAHNPRHLVLDDEIGAWLSRLGTANVTMIVDACFSGTVTRGSPDTSATAPVARGPRPPPFATLGASGALLDAGRSMNHTLLTAASSSELAYEKTFHPGAVVSGIFTRYLAEALDGATPNTRFDELLQQVRAKVGQGQTPQLEGERAARIFKVGADALVPARGFAIVRAPKSGRVGLDVGALHGVRKGALYDVYGATETTFRGQPIARLRVDSIFEASSFATVLPGGRAIPLSARATLSRVPPGAMSLGRLRLFVNPNAGVLRDSLARLDWLELTNGPAGATAELRRRGSAYQVVVGGHELPPLRGDDGGGRSIAVGPDGVRGYKGSSAALCTPLRRALAISAMNLVRNDQPPPPSRLKLELQLLPASTGVPARRPGSVDTAFVGERYDIVAWITVDDRAAQNSTLYLTAGIAGYTSAPQVIWPRGTEQSALTREQLTQPLKIASGVSFQPPTGIENIKAVVSSDPFSLAPLVNGLPQCGGGVRDGSRGGPPADPSVVTGWTAAERRVEIYTR